MNLGLMILVCVGIMMLVLNVNDDDRYNNDVSDGDYEIGDYMNYMNLMNHIDSSSL